MPEFMKKRSQKTGLPPGSLVHIGANRGATELRLIYYDGEHFEQQALRSLDQTSAFLQRPGVTWIHVCGVHDVAVLQHLDRFGLHPLVLEDIVNTDQRTKFEDYGDYIFLVLKMLCDAPAGGIALEQISIVLGRNFVITVEENPSGAFDSVRALVEKGKGQVRAAGADYLAYLLLDKAVDNYFAVLERFGERVDALQDELIHQPSRDDLRQLHQLRREMLLLRRSIWPVRELVAGLERERPGLIRPETHVYLRDVYDHAVHVVDNVETLREILSGMLDIYISSLSYRMNEVMKVLTIITTIFMPLTFIAGVYGMNFRYMPELEWRWGYPAVLLVMGCVAAYMLRQFRKKGWL